MGALGPARRGPGRLGLLAGGCVAGCAGVWLLFLGLKLALEQGAPQALPAAVPGAVVFLLGLGALWRGLRKAL